MNSSNELNEMLEEFCKQGYIIIPNVFDSGMLGKLNSDCDDLFKINMSNSSSQSKSEFKLTSLVDYPNIFNLISNEIILKHVVKILGYNIRLSYASLVFSPKQDVNKPQMKLHQDSGHLNRDLASNSPLLSVKASIWMTSGQASNIGNFYVIPRSMKQRNFREATKDSEEVVVLVNPGDVILFDSRVWHGKKTNLSDVTRRVMFCDYSYRWIMPKMNFDSINLENLIDVQKQLLGSSRDSWSFFCPKEDDLPLKEKYEPI